MYPFLIKEVIKFKTTQDSKDNENIEIANLEEVKILTSSIISRNLEAFKELSK